MTTTTTTASGGDDTNHLFFGSLNHDLADVIYQSIQEQLMKSLQALPMLNDDDYDGDTMTVEDGVGSSSTTPSRMGRLYQYLLKQYSAAVDLIELYNARNTFSIHMIQPRSRQNEVLALYRRYIEVDSNGDLWNEVDWVGNGNTDCTADDSMNHHDVTMDDDTATTDNLKNIPTMDDIPTAEDLQTIQTEITTLHDRYQQLLRQQALLTQEMATLQTVQHQQQDLSNPIVLSSQKDTIVQHLAQTVPVLQALQDCQHTSAQLQHKMTTIEQERRKHYENENPNHHYHDLNDIVVAVPCKKTKYPVARPATIQERYQQDSVMVSVPSTTRSSDNDDVDAHLRLATVLTTLRGPP